MIAALGDELSRSLRFATWIDPLLFTRFILNLRMVFSIPDSTIIDGNSYPQGS